MARDARRWNPSDIHHVVVRAHCGVPIFARDRERAFVVERGAYVFAETQATCLGWAVLDNHYHVLVRCAGPPGPTFARLNTAIAWRVSQGRGERGAVFQDRFFSAPCEDENAVLTRLAYVLGNPVHHRIVPSIAALRRHAWSGLGEILGLHAPKWIDVPAALALVDPDPGRARAELLRFLVARAAAWAEDVGDPAIDRGLENEVPGDVEPVDASTRVSQMESTDDGTALLGHSSCIAVSPPRVPVACVRNELRREGWTPGALIPVVCDLFGASPDRVRAGIQSRPDAAARAVLAHVACDVAGFTMVDVAPVVGLGPTALQYARRRGREHLAARGVLAATLLDLSRRGPSGLDL